MWDDKLGGVVGMIVAAESGKTPASYLIPTRDLTAAWPRLGELTTPPTPFRSRLRPRALRRWAVVVAVASTAVVVAGTAVLVSSMSGNAGVDAGAVRVGVGGPACNEVMVIGGAVVVTP